MWRLIFALYGHPLAGDYWGKHLSTILKKFGLSSIEGWPGLYFKSILKAGKRSCVIVVTYVDDLLLIGVNQTPGLMDALKAAIEMDPPHPINKYLGAIHKMGHEEHRRLVVRIVRS